MTPVGGGLTVVWVTHAKPAPCRSFSRSLGFGFSHERTTIFGKKMGGSCREKERSIFFEGKRVPHAAVGGERVWSTDNDGGSK
jgi:hypothetical protein